MRRGLNNMRKDERNKLNEMEKTWEVSHLLSDKMEDINEILLYLEGIAGSNIYVPCKRIYGLLNQMLAEQYLMHKIIEQDNLEKARANEEMTSQNTNRESHD